MADIQINELLEAQTAADSDWIAIDNGSATKKISVSNFNATGAASAAQSAAAAAQSASDAASAKTAAEQAEDDTEALITSAQTIVSDAQTYAGEAATSANTASTAANTATAQAAIASQAASTAAGYAQNVDNFAKTAKSWAVGGTGSRQGEDQDNSQYYSQQAHTSEINAAASETAAAASEANAAASETAAAASESNAATSESNAASSETNAAASESNAATSASNAASSESNAATSETNAAASATAAGESEDDSEAWAWGKIDGVDVPATHPAYHNNAKYWADAASGGVSGVSSFNGRSGNVTSQSGDYAANIVEFDPLNNALISTTVQDAIEEVQGNIEALATVATTGSYNDLTNKPTLGTAAAKDSTNAVTQSSTDLVESGAVYTALDDKMDKANPTGTGALSLNRRSGSYVGQYSVALGSNAQANGYISFAEGNYTTAGANYTHAAGNNTKASYDNQFTVGKFNDVKATTLFEVGNGTDTSNRSNAFEVYSDGLVSVDNGTTKVDLTDVSLIADKQDATDNNLATTSKTVVGAINEVNTAVGTTNTTITNKHKVTRFEVSTSSWASDTTSQSGTTLYKKSIALSHVYVDSPSVDIGATGVLPTTAQQEAYNLLQYVTVDSAVPCLYLYASDIPTNAFYINVEGVD